SGIHHRPFRGRRGRKKTGVPKDSLGSAGRAPYSSGNCVHGRGFWRDVVVADFDRGRQAGRAHVCRSCDPSAGNSKEHNVHGNGRIETIGRTTKRENVRIERKL